MREGESDISIEQGTLDALQLLTLPPDSLQIQSLHPDVRAAVDAARPWIAGPNVVGTGASFKQVLGTSTAEYSLRIYVRRKLGNDLIPDSQQIPPEVTVPGIADPIPTDVLEIGDLRLDALSTQERPVLPGYSVGLLGLDTGTLGCFVAKTDNPSVPLALSNSHVLAQSGIAAAGQSITQPSKADGGSADSIIGSLVFAVPFVFSAGFNNLCDAAIAAVDSSVAVSCSIPTIGTPKAPSPERSVRVGDTIQKTGRTTGYTTGVVQDLHFQTTIPYPSPVGGTGNASFREQVLCSVYASSGDSGSLVCDSDSVAVGLHWLGSSAVSVFSPIQFVFQQLELQLWGGVASEEAQAALEQHRSGLMGLPGVEGLGVREPPAAGGPDCEVAVYVDTPENAVNVPRSVRLDRDKDSVGVRVQPVVIGVLSPQARQGPAPPDP